MSRQRKSINSVGIWRLNVVRLVFISLVIGLGWRLTDIQVLNPDFLRNQGDARHVRKVPVAAHRGMILDRHGEPLAISTPVHSVWVNPQEINVDSVKLPKLAKVLHLNAKKIKNKINSNQNREFIYLKRRVAPETANKVKQLNIAGVALQREYKRFYPTGEVAAHVVGFTNVDDAGQEGLELTHDAVLTGVSGLKRMIRDSRGNYVGGGEQLKATKHGQNISLSIDLRLQYLTYQALKASVVKYKARSGSAVILDIKTGEVLAMVNQPSFNPNSRRGLRNSEYRNRAVTDLFEPGSTVKPFTVASGLKSGKFTPATIIDTRPGTLRVSGHTIKDFRDYGQISVSTLIQKSSNVAASKIALALKPEQLWQDFSAFGLAEPTGAYFPGEAMGHLPDPQKWRKLDRATLAYGYGVASSALQLARGYMVLANGGILRPVSFVKVDQPPQGRRVFSRDDMKQVLTMMERVVQPGGTAQKAAVENYTVAGKTGTVKKAASGGYADKQYLSLFAGVIPATQPRLAMVVMVDDPQGKEYYGGLVAAPVFSEVMTGAMRLLNIAPDDLPMTQLHVAQK
ncbi:MAG: penicillin-binding protein 2 [Gammaproteobacteria bacterium]|nr:MAG: penicillin-binding protein 2 [Gammaproteobacteria bacterium]RKZ95416.1 MAG: penicillin-binding protein 2 [Gammaproteobacteria bacterium]RKZ98537.1 MAG: penicillin-binding protein 2 [Gammaproteobacteria bacterium]